VVQLHLSSVHVGNNIDRKILGGRSKNKMPLLRKLQIFVASPEEMADERQRLERVINELNDTIAEEYGWILAIKNWQQVPPAMDRPEEVILKALKVESWDVFIGIFWKRFGTPTGAIDSQTGREFSSGTEEEFKLAYRLWKEKGRPHIMFYRCIRPPKTLNELDADQYKLVSDFFKKFASKAEHPGLYKEFLSAEDLAESVRRGLTALLKENQKKFPPVDPTPPSETNESQVITFKGKEYIYIPAGKFKMGSTRERVNELKRESKGFNEKAFEFELPDREINLEGYYIARYPVTNKEYHEFLNAHPDRPVPFRNEPASEPYNWNEPTRSYPEEKDNHPVVLVSWHDAQAYCQWLGGRLPTEAEWEKAARGANSSEWPWGNDWQEGCCNSAEWGSDQILPVGSLLSAGDSVYGVGDMSGNVWEWCSTLFRRYPYLKNDGRENPRAQGERVIRGGTFGSTKDRVRCAYRDKANPNTSDLRIGFRVAFTRLPQD
jgi:formylglycine-generating enzyme required for sulfatase activity